MSIYARLGFAVLRCIGAAALEARAGLADRVLDHLRLLDNDYGGFPVDRLEHCLQTATLAEQDGMDEEYIVCALLHDIGDTLGSYNHADVAAVILQPFVSEKNHWMVKHHGILQGYYFFHYIGLDRNARDAYKDHEFYQRCDCQQLDCISVCGGGFKQAVFVLQELERSPKNGRRASSHINLPSNAR